MPDILRVFIGVDPRQPISASVFAHSIHSRSSKPVSITMLRKNQLPISKSGLTEFTYTRFLVPWLCKYEGVALFADADMLCLGDIADLFDMYDEEKDVQVVKHEQKFEWPSLMLFNCRNCWKLTPEAIEYADNLFKMEDWANVGELPPEWNLLVGYDNPRSDVQLIHYTEGVPVWKETADCDFAEEWHNDRQAMMSTCSFQDLMGNSVHPTARKHAKHTGN